MIIAIDLDSVLNNLGEVWLGRYNRDYGDCLTDDDIHSWDTDKYVKSECGKSIYGYLNDPTLYLECSPAPGSQEVIQSWVDEGHTVLVVSSCARGAYDAKRQWLAEHYPMIDKDNFIAAHKKQYIDADVLVDDGPHNIADWPADRWSILFARPWNRDVREADYRAQGWQQVGLYFQEIQDQEDDAAVMLTATAEAAP